jgi:four helix bundle protein
VNQQVRSHKDLDVWQMAMALVEQVYALAGRFPASEKYGLVSQITRSAVSIPANIAEGHARGTRRDYAHFISIARGSLMETETYILLAVRLGFVDQGSVDNLMELITRISKMLGSLRRRLLQQPNTQPRKPSPQSPTPNTDGTE